MALNTKDAKRQPMSADVRDWCATGAPAETRTLVLRLAPSADVSLLSVELRNLGAEIVSAGPAATVASLTCRSVPQASRLPGVLRIESPSRLSPKLGS